MFQETSQLRKKAINARIQYGKEQSQENRNRLQVIKDCYRDVDRILKDYDDLDGEALEVA